MVCCHRRKGPVRSRLRGLLVHAETDTGAGEETGAETVAERHPHDHELMEFEELVGGGRRGLLGLEYAERDRKKTA